MPVTISGTPSTSIVAACSVPAANDFVTGAGLQVTATAIEGDIATIKGGSYTTTANVTHGGSDTFTGQVTVARVARRERVLLTDAAHTVDVTQADTFILNNAPAATRLITLSMTTGTPLDGERIRFIIPALTHVTGSEYQFTRGGTAGLLANVFSSTVVRAPISIEFEHGFGLLLLVTGTGSGASGRVKLTLSPPSGWSGFNATDSLATGDTVVVSGVAGTTEANGTWVITVNDANHITLTGTTYVNAYVSGGTAQVSGGVWRLGMNSGSSYDGGAVYGVVPDSAS